MFSIHIFGLLFSLVIVTIADEQAFSWVTGKKSTLHPTGIRVLHWLTWVGLLTMIVSGTILALPMFGFVLAQPLFIMKMLFVAILFLNAILIGRFSHVATERAFATLSWDEAMPLLISGALSFMGWIGALVLALIVFG